MSLYDDTYNQRAKFIADPVTWREARLDNLADALVVIPYDHHEVHGGSMFFTEIHTAAGTAVNICFKTPAGTKRAHMTFEYVAESKAHLNVLEGATWTTDTGTVVAPTNMHRGSANTSMFLEDKTATPAFTAGGVLTNATSPTGGTELFEHYTFASKQTGSESGTRQEVILKPDSTYAIVLTSDDGSKGLQLRLLWYEHTDTEPLV